MVDKNLKEKTKGPSTQRRPTEQQIQIGKKKKKTEEASAS